MYRLNRKILNHAHHSFSGVPMIPRGSCVLSPLSPLLTLRLIRYGTAISSMPPT